MTKNFVMSNANFTNRDTASEMEDRSNFINNIEGKNSTQIFRNKQLTKILSKD